MYTCIRWIVTMCHDVKPKFHTVFCGIRQIQSQIALLQKKNLNIFMILIVPNCYRINDQAFICTWRKLGIQNCRILPQVKVSNMPTTVNKGLKNSFLTFRPSLPDALWVCSNLFKCLHRFQIREIFQQRLLYLGTTQHSQSMCLKVLTCDIFFKKRLTTKDILYV